MYKKQLLKKKNTFFCPYFALNMWDVIYIFLKYFAFSSENHSYSTVSDSTRNLLREGLSFKFIPKKIIYKFFNSSFFEWNLRTPRPLFGAPLSTINLKSKFYGKKRLKKFIRSIFIVPNNSYSFFSVNW